MPVWGVVGIAAAVIAGVLLFFLVSRAVLLPAIKAARDKVRNLGAGHVITSTDGSTQVTVPFTWSVTTTDLNPRANLQVSCPVTDEYLIVISENKADFPGMTLERYSAIVRGKLAGKMSSVEQSGPTELQLDGNRAIQYKINGVYQGRQVAMETTILHTCTEDSVQYHQIMAWTYRSHFEQNQDDLQKVIASFKSRFPAAASATTESLPAPGPPLPAAPQTQPLQPKPAAVVNGMNANRTQMMGSGDKEFTEISPDSGVLIGFEVGFGEFFGNPVIHSLRPIYRTAQGEVTGTQYGTFDHGQMVIKAKPGYAIGGLTVKAGLGIDGFSVTFMRMAGGVLVTADSYTSDWIGGKGGGRETTLAGTGACVPGIFGKTNSQNILTGFGLVLSGSAAK